MEFLVAIVIILVGLLGLLKGIEVTLDKNMASILRNQAVMLADEKMTVEKTKPFNNISTVGARTVIDKVGSKNIAKEYSVTKTGNIITENTKRIDIQVQWTHKGKSHTHTLSSLVSRFQ